MPDMARYTLAWRNPYTQPPQGQPRVLKAMLVVRGERCPAEISDLHVPGSGYSIGWELVTQKPIRRWSPEAKGATRRRNLRKRLEKKVPLFADMFEQEELTRRASYFAGGEERASSL